MLGLFHLPAVLHTLRFVRIFHLVFGTKIESTYRESNSYVWTPYLKKASGYKIRESAAWLRAMGPMVLGPKKPLVHK